MSMPISRQGEQFDVFDGDRWDRDRRAAVSDNDVADMLRGPAITAGLLNTRQAADWHDPSLPPPPQFAPLPPARQAPPMSQRELTDFHSRGLQEGRSEPMTEQEAQEFRRHAADYPNPHAPVPDSYWHDDEADERHRQFDQEHGLDRDPPPEYDDYGPGPDPSFQGGGALPFDTPTYNPRSAPYDDHPPSFSAARHHADGGPIGELLNPMLFAPGDRLDWRSGLGVRGDNEPHETPTHWPTASTEHQGAPVVPQVQDPVWLGHGYSPGNRVGLPWRDGTIPGTVTHLDGPTIGVRWDDGQHSNEEPGDINLLH